MSVFKGVESEHSDKELLHTQA